MAEPKHSKLVLIDGYNFVFRAYHSLPPLKNPKKEPVGAVYGFTNMLLKILSEVKASHIAVIFDSGQKNFRHDIYTAYKANRPPAPEDLIPQFPMVRDVAASFNLKTIEKPGFEADDIIATLARQGDKAGMEVLILSSDKDLLQLVTPNISMYDAMKSLTLNRNEVIEKFGVPPEKVLDYLSLMGDSSDNIPGVPGIGPKTALELITQYGNLEEVLAQAVSMKPSKRKDNLIEFKEQALLSRQLLTLDENVPLDLTLDDLKVQIINEALLVAYMRSQGFNSLVTRLEKTLGIKDEQVSEIINPKTNLTKITNLDELNQFIKNASKAGLAFIYLIYNDAGSPVRLELSYDEINYLEIAVKITEDQFLLANFEKSDIFDFAKVIAKLSSLLEDESVQKITYDLKHLLWMLDKINYNAQIQAFEDLLVIAYCLNCGKSKRGLTDLLREEFADENMEPNAANCLALYKKMWPMLTKDQVMSLYSRIEKPLIYTLFDMEKEGVRIDPTVLKLLASDFAKLLAEYSAKIFKESGMEFNIASPKQIGEVLFKNMALPASKINKSGNYTTDSETLEELAEGGYQIAEDILNWRQIAKLKSTYVDSLPLQINPRTGRIHTSFMMDVASTGRLSSVNPNLQNIPIRSEESKKIRACFVAAPGNKLLSVDYSQIELRLLAEVADIPQLKLAFKEDKDIHAVTASEIFSVPLEQVDEDLRRQAKTINFGIIYGISGFGLARRIGITRDLANKYIKTYFERYPGIKDYMEKAKEFAATHGYVRTIFGRKCYIEGINDKNGQRRSFAERAAINAPLQGAAADIIKIAMNEVASELKKQGFKSKMLLQVHDELLFEGPADEMDRLTQMVIKTMESVVSMSVPMKLHAKVGNNWAEIH